MFLKFAWKKGKRTGIFALFAITAILLLAVVQPVWAKEKPAEEGGWEISASAYMWFLTLSGDVTVKGNTSHVDMDFGDIWSELNMAGMGAFEARKGNWGLLFDGLYSDLGKSEIQNNIWVDPNIELMILNFGGFYRVGTWDLSDSPDKKGPMMTLDVLGGARYTSVDVSLNFNGVLEVGGRQSWVDPIVGARSLFDLSERWILALEGSIGGFGVGSNFTWGAYGSLGYRFGLFSKEKNARVFGGYRFLSQDYDDGYGTSRFEWDATLHGPIMGLIVTF